MVAALGKTSKAGQPGHSTERLGHYILLALYPQQHASYAALVTALSKHFTPFRIQAVPSSLFCEWRQGPKEAIDDYAKDLRRLFYRTYP